MDDAGLDPLSMLMDDEPTAQEKARAYSAALRGQRRVADVQQQFGLLNQFSGDRVLDGVGKSLTSAAQQGYANANANERNTSLSQYHQDVAEQKRLAAQQDQYNAENHLGKYAGNVTTKETADGTLFGINNKTGSAEQIYKSASRLPKAMGGGSGGTGPVDPNEEAMIERHAKDFNLGAGLPQLGNGKDAAALKRKILMRASALAGPDGEGVASATADRKADVGSLTHMRTQSDAIGSFIGTFDRNVATLEDSLKRLKSSNSPLLNKGYRWWQQNASADPALTEFVNALATVQSEMGKINSGSTGAGGVPISLMEEMQHNLPANATPEQLMAGLKIARKDSENRRAAMQESISGIRGRISGKPVQGHGAETSPAPALNPGEVMMVDKKGGLHAVPESQVQAALDHKWKKS